MKYEEIAEDIHNNLLSFLGEYQPDPEPNMHNVIESCLWNMLCNGIAGLNEYLKDGHTNVNQQEILHVLLDSFQKSLDVIKRSVDSLRC